MIKTQNKVVTIEGLAFNGQPFCTVNSTKVFLFGPFFPGDKVEISTDDDRSYHVSELIEPSKIRVKPDCVFYGPCGGCDLLEMSEKSRKSEKAAMIKRCVESLSPEDMPDIKPFDASKELIRYLPRSRS